MRGLRTLLLAAALLLPTSAWAVPVSIDVYSWASYVHTSTGCPSSGFLLCGAPTGFVSGTLTADRDGDLLTGISGDLTLLGVDHAVTGSLDLSAATLGSVAGSLTIGSLGVFEFWNETLFIEANDLDGNDLFLWGQNFARYTAPPQGALGIHLSGVLTDTDDELFQPIDDGDSGQVPAVPEPSAAALFALGTLAVIAQRRRS